MESKKTTTQEMETLLEEKNKLIETLQERNRYLESRNIVEQHKAQETLSAVIRLEDELHSIRNSLIKNIFRDENGIKNIVYEEATSDNGKTPCSKNDIRAEDRTEIEKEILKLIGEGMSVGQEIRVHASKNTRASESTVFRFMNSLTEDGILVSIAGISSPELKKAILYKLTDHGKEVYRQLFNAEPSVPEMEILKTAYGNYEQGYGVRACEKLLVSSGLFDKVVIDPEGVKSIGGIKLPHLICETKDGKPEYFEFHRCKQKDVEYYNRFQKLSEITDEINIIVSSPDEHDRMHLLLAAWASSRKDDPHFRNKIIRLTNYNKIRHCVQNKKPFSDWWYITDKLKDLLPPLGYDGPFGKGI